MIKIILWDIDATLLDFLKSENMALKKAFARFDLGECTDSTVAEYSAINQSYWNRLETGELTKEQVLVGRFEEFLNVKGFCDVDANEFCEFYESSLPDCVEFIGNAEETIKALSNSYYQYAVTNGAKNVQTKNLQCRELTAYSTAHLFLMMSATQSRQRSSSILFCRIYQRLLMMRF